MANQQGDGGNAPRGGSGGKGGNQTTGNATAGGVCGGGGGGAGGVAGAGGNGCVVIYEYTTVASGADIAENYPVSDPSIGPGDIVAFDAGFPLVVARADEAIKRPLVGIISTDPGIILGDRDDLGTRPVALAGRVPTKVNLEGGSIAVGDRIALSSVPGVGRKASVFDDTVGVALSAYDGTQEEASVIVFIDLQRGIEIEAVGAALLGGMDGLTVIASSTDGSFDFVGGMMQAIASRIFGVFGAASTTAATSTDEIASTTTASGDSGMSAFVRSIFASIRQWFADAGNGIGSVFADAFHARNEICVDDQCLDREDVRSLLALASGASASGGSVASVPTGAPMITVNGNNPAQVEIASGYVDLGAIVTDDVDHNLGLELFVDGTPVEAVTIDTGAPATFTVTYRATDTDGHVTEAARTVIVGAGEGAVEEYEEYVEPAPEEEEPIIVVPAAEVGPVPVESSGPVVEPAPAPSETSDSSSGVPVDTTAQTAAPTG